MSIAAAAGGAWCGAFVAMMACRGMTGRAEAGIAVAFFALAALGGTAFQLMTASLSGLVDSSRLAFESFAWRFAFEPTFTFGMSAVLTFSAALPFMTFAAMFPDAPPPGAQPPDTPEASPQSSRPETPHPRASDRIEPRF